MKSMNYRLVLSGFLQTVTFPLLAFTLQMVGYFRGSPSSTYVLTVLYPGGILLLAMYPIALSPRDYPADFYLEYCRGAFLAVLTILGASAVPFLASILYHQLLVGTGFFLVSFGSYWLPSASAAWASGYLLAHENAPLNVRRSNDSTFKGLTGFFVTLFLGVSHIWKSRKSSIRSIVFFLIISTYGWILLSLAGGFPVTLFGAFAGLLVPFSSYKSFMRRTSGEERSKISNLLVQQFSQYDASS